MLGHGREGATASLPDVRVLAGEIRRGVRRSAGRPRARGHACGSCSTAGGATRSGAPAHPDGRGRRPHPVVPSADASAGAQGPPDPPEGADRRRSGRVHRRGRHRRRMEGRRAQRAGGATRTSAFADRRWTAFRPFLDNWLETDDVLFEASVDRFPDQPQAGSSLVQCGEGIGAGLERHLGRSSGVAAARTGRMSGSRRRTSSPTRS